MKFLRYSVGNFFSKISCTYYLLSAFIANINAINDNNGAQEHLGISFSFSFHLHLLMSPRMRFLGFNSHSNALVLRARMIVNCHSGPIYLFFFSLTY